MVVEHCVQGTKLPRGGQSAGGGVGGVLGWIMQFWEIRVRV